MMTKAIVFKGVLLGLAVWSLGSLATARADLLDGQDFAASDSTEALMTFKHRVEFTLPAGKKVSEDVARSKISSQLNHLFGPMSVARFKAVPKGNEDITNVSVSRKRGTQRTYIAEYSYRGMIDLQNGAGPTYEIILPINPDRVYYSGIVTRGDGQKQNVCTDEHYQSREDFWYFWNPAKSGCTLRSGEHYDVVVAEVKRVPNTKQTYPEYARLVDSSGTIRIDILMGMNDPAELKNPMVSQDVNARNYRAIRNALMNQMGFSGRVLERGEIRSRSGSARALPYVEEFVLQTPKAKVLVNLFFGQSGMDEPNTAFHYFYKDAVENASVMMYDGHSGLGANLDLEDIESTQDFEVKLPKNKYQIYYFNSCSSYSYYNTVYFARKKSKTDPKGTRNLDILTNGLATYFSVMGETDLVLVQAIVDWASNKTPATYQQIATEIDSGNLFGVNGDEDNPVSISQ